MEDRYYAYIPEDSLEICDPCEDVKYLENNSGLVVGFGSDPSQIIKIKRYGGEPQDISSQQSKSHIYVAVAMHFNEPLIEGKFIPISVQIMESGSKKLLTGQDVSYEEKMKSWRNAAKQMRDESNNILEYLIRDSIYLLAILFLPVLFYGLYVWVRKGFDSKS